MDQKFTTKDKIVLWINVIILLGSVGYLIYYIYQRLHKKPSGKCTDKQITVKGKCTDCPEGTIPDDKKQKCIKDCGLGNTFYESCGPSGICGPTCSGCLQQKCFSNSDGSFSSICICPTGTTVDMYGNCALDSDLSDFAIFNTDSCSVICKNSNESFDPISRTCSKICDYGYTTCTGQGNTCYPISDSCNSVVSGDGKITTAVVPITCTGGTVCMTTSDNSDLDTICKANSCNCSPDCPEYLNECNSGSIQFSGYNPSLRSCVIDKQCDKQTSELFYLFPPSYSGCTQISKKLDPTTGLCIGPSSYQLKDICERDSNGCLSGNTGCDPTRTGCRQPSQSTTFTDYGCVDTTINYNLLTNIVSATTTNIFGYLKYQGSEVFTGLVWIYLIVPIVSNGTTLVNDYNNAVINYFSPSDTQGCTFPDKTRCYSFTITPDQTLIPNQNYRLILYGQHQGSIKYISSNAENNDTAGEAFTPQQGVDNSTRRSIMPNIRKDISDGLANTEIVTNYIQANPILRSGQQVSYPISPSQTSYTEVVCGPDLCYNVETGNRNVVNRKIVIIAWDKNSAFKYVVFSQRIDVPSSSILQIENDQIPSSGNILFIANALGVGEMYIYRIGAYKSNYNSWSDAVSANVNDTSLLRNVYVYVEPYTKGECITIPVNDSPPFMVREQTTDSPGYCVVPSQISTSIYGSYAAKDFDCAMRQKNISNVSNITDLYLFDSNNNSCAQVYPNRSVTVDFTGTTNNLLNEWNENNTNDIFPEGVKYDVNLYCGCEGKACPPTANEIANLKFGNSQISYANAVSKIDAMNNFIGTYLPSSVYTSGPTDGLKSNIYSCPLNNNPEYIRNCGEDVTCNSLSALLNCDSSYCGNLVQDSSNQSIYRLPVNWFNKDDINTVAKICNSNGVFKLENPGKQNVRGFCDCLGATGTEGGYASSPTCDPSGGTFYCGTDGTTCYFKNSMGGAVSYESCVNKTSLAEGSCKK